MLKHNLKYEWVSLLRDRWVMILVILFFCLTFFALRNANDKVNERKQTISKEQEKVKKLDAQFAADIDSINNKLKPAPTESWYDPRSLTRLAWDASRVVAMEPQAFAIVSTGQSDLFTHYVKPRLYGEAYTLGFSELSNPVQLLFGSFDLAFVCIYLLPLLALAFSYNILSSEKESGVLKLTFSQPVDLYSWLFHKLMLRFVVLSVIVTGCITLGLLIFNVDVAGNLLTWFKLISILLFYLCFWFAVAFLVNLFGQSSGNNAITSVSIWLVFVLLIPSIISQLSTRLNPVPSRIHMMHEYRLASAKANKQADEIFKNYLRDHPELAARDTTAENQYDWLLQYFASSEVINQSVKPIVDNYYTALNQQQQWVDNLRFLSPAILLQNSLNELSGTSTAHYAAFRKEVLAFADVWKNYFKPRMFANELMQSADIAQLPKPNGITVVENHFEADFFGILVFVILALAGSMFVYKRMLSNGLVFKW
jgi:ABC-2 type transport system permease protein